ncbi:NADH-quinone oxidoreductase subunit J [Buchnera aphidicola (Melanaphis sacchari)]|uniref:NADH-quinone oxidoreductase subunit J n=1 Tax=Buchnera aphidicola (Melanaphis sacchari) TaxID=2173854 RepID=A0A2U8DHA6_9GAMM|nr:NADH-quinone oxidoreductase subunit J [Buchnera aphidicola]AWH90604.1 NADH-quinone oxidoreductase subunit J [Buchnera aphidicola (Melanaphis sacchari)]
MNFAFFICSFIAIISTCFTVFQKNAIYSLIYLIVSLLSISGIFFSLGAFFAGALEVIIYAGAIIVLFIFVIMTLNLENKKNLKEKKCLNPIYFIGSGLLLLVLFITMTYSIFFGTNQKIKFFLMQPKSIGISLFGPYVFLVEIASLLLLCALIIVFHIGMNKKTNKKDY